MRRNSTRAWCHDGRQAFDVTGGFTLYTKRNQVFGLPCDAPDFGPRYKSSPKTRMFTRPARWSRDGLVREKQQGANDGDRYREVLQHPKGIWIYSAERRLARRVRAHQRGGARRNALAHGRPEDQL